MAITLRDYQQEAIDRTIESLKAGNKRIMIVLPTGGGKTAIASELVRRSFEKGRSSTFMCHRQELLDQTYITYGKNGIVPAFIKGGRHPDYNNTMQIASVNTLVKRLDMYKKPNILFVDECFIGNTKVLTKCGAKKIKHIKTGDIVKTFNEKTGIFEYKRVLKSIKKDRKERLFCISVDEKNIVCTENHLFFTKNGWTKAKDLCITDMVLTTTHQKGELNDFKMRKLRFRSRNNEVEEGTQETNRRSFVSKMHKGETKKNIFRDNVENKSDLFFRENEKKQSYVQSRCKSKSFNNASCYGMEADCSWWKWIWPNRSSDASCVSSWMGNGGCCSNRSLSGWKWISNLLQNRYCKSIFKNSNRSRWRISLKSFDKRTRQKEREVPCWKRVESCKIYKQRCWFRPKWMCKNRFVYDLTVEDNHNYFVDGVLVHNCHHCKASQWNKVIDYYKDSVVIGLTATPCRLDGKPLGDMYDDMIEVTTVKKLIKSGYLCPYLYYAPSVIDTSELKSSGGDYTKKSLEEASFNSKIIGDNIAQYKKIANGRRNVVFAISRRHGKAICERYNEAGVSAEFLDGETHDRERKAVLERFKNGQTKVLVNVDLFGEGFDLPAIEVVSLLRPTQSLSLYLQQVGRALRICPEIGKTHAIILDHVNNYKTHGMPDDEREWTLDGKKKASRKTEESVVKMRRCPECFFAHPPALSCPACGYKYGADGKEIKEVAGELVLVGSDEYKKLCQKEVIVANNYEDLVRIEADRGYKCGWADKQYQLKTGINLRATLEGLEEIARVRNYDRRWAWIQYRRRYS